MTNQVEFILKLKDLMSSPMMKAAQTTKQAMAQVEAAVGKTARNTVRSVGDMNRRLDDLRKTRELSVDMRQIRAANREIDRLERQIGRVENAGRRGGAGKSGGGILGMLGLSSGMVATAGVTAALVGAGSLAGMGMEADMTRTSMQVLAGQDAGGKLFADVQKFARESIFGNELFKNAQTMKAFGMATDQVMPTLKMLGDISMGDKEKLGSLTLAFSQSQAAGRLMGQDLLQMVGQGFNPLQEISLMTGASMETLRKKMEEGAISADMVRKAFEHATGPAGQFYQMTEKIAKTSFGKKEAMKGQLRQIGTDIGTAMLPTVIKLLEAVQPILDILPDIAKELEPVFVLIGDLVKQLVPLMISSFQTFMPVLRNIVHILSVVLPPVLKILIPLVDMLFKVVGWVFEKILDVSSWLADQFAWLYNKVGDFVNWLTGYVAQVPNVLAKKLKEGLSNSDIVNFMKTMGNAHGAAYVDSVIAQYERIAGYLDRIYNTGGIFTRRVQEIKNSYSNPAAATTTTPGKVSMGTMGLSDSSNKITGGGVRAINITIGKFWDDLIFNVSDTKEAVAKTGDQVAEALQRLLYSANEMQ